MGDACVLACARAWDELVGMNSSFSGSEKLAAPSSSNSSHLQRAVRACGTSAWARGCPSNRVPSLLDGHDGASSGLFAVGEGLSTLFESITITRYSQHVVFLKFRKILR